MWICLCQLPTMESRDEKIIFVWPKGFCPNIIKIFIIWSFPPGFRNHFHLVKVWIKSRSLKCFFKVSNSFFLNGSITMECSELWNITRWYFMNLMSVWRWRSKFKFRNIKLNLLEACKSVKIPHSFLPHC